ncbi:MAG: Crp/Fnr family transcriptional regulator [Bacteroidetes bacterium]|jgi:CRP-like cAMP-binding protein|nr:Crp/Fnr family transcriptional regulator [Bacteroidota bacterium]
MSTCNECKIKSTAATFLNKNELENLSQNCAEVSFKNRSIILQQGALSSNIIYLKTGLVKIHISVFEKEHIIKILKAPLFLGIPTTLKEKINQYSVTAIEQVTVCFIDINLFNKFIIKNGEFAYEIIVDLCCSELDYIKVCLNRKQKNTIGRVADTLLFFANKIYNSDNYTLPLSRLELGNLIDTSRENICRILSQLNDDGIINSNGKKIKIINMKSLETISIHG